MGYLLQLKSKLYKSIFVAVILTALHLAVIGVTVALVFTGYDVFPAIFDNLPLYLYNKERLKELSWKSKNNYENSVYRPVFGYEYNAGYRGRVKDCFEMIYETPNGGNILTKKNLELIKHAEDKLFEIPRYQRHFCLWNTYYVCVKPQSLIRLFDGTYSHVDAVFNDPTFSNITHVIYLASVYNETREFLELFIAKDAVISETHSFTSISRSMVLMGWPLYYIDGRYGNEYDIKLFLANVLKPEAENLRDFKLVGELDMYYISKFLYEYDLVQQALQDIKLAIGSVLFIFVFMCFQTGSIIITSLGILSILSSFLLTNLFYRYALQYEYFGFFHVISMFLILGIGADDLFVFYDTWRLTGHTKYPDDAHRLSDCYRKAAKTTFVTSVTTMTAFLVSGLSPLLPVKTFGIFSGILVGLNYVWVVVYFPSVIMLHHTKTKFIWLKIKSVLSARLCSKRNGKDARRGSIETTISVDSNNVIDTGSTKDLIDNNKKELVPMDEHPTHSNKTRPDSSAPCLENDTTQGQLSGGVETSTDNTDLRYLHHVPVPLDLKKLEHETARQEISDIQKNKPRKNFEDRNKVVLFLRNGFFDFMTKRVVKVTLPLLFLAVSVFFIHRSTMIEPDSRQVGASTSC